MTRRPPTNAWGRSLQQDDFARLGAAFLIPFRRNYKWRIREKYLFHLANLLDYDVSRNNHLAVYVVSGYGAGRKFVSKEFDTAIKATDYLLGTDDAGRHFTCSCRTCSMALRVREREKRHEKAT
jgi:hypothetical protein